MKHAVCAQPMVVGVKSNSVARVARLSIFIVFARNQVFGAEGVPPPKPVPQFGNAAPVPPPNATSGFVAGSGLTQAGPARPEVEFALTIVMLLMMSSTATM